MLGSTPPKSHRIVDRGNIILIYYLQNTEYDEIVIPNEVINSAN